MIKISKSLFIVSMLAMTYSTIHVLTSIPRSMAMVYKRAVYPCSLVSTRGSCSDNSHSWNDIDIIYGGRSVFNRLDELFSIPMRVNSLIQGYERQWSNSLSQLNESSYRPRFWIESDDEQIKLSLEVPAMRATDIKLFLEKNGKLLVVKGLQSSRSDDNQKIFRSSEFEQKFALNDTTLDVKELKAALSNGVLVISVPRIQQQQRTEDMKIEEIPIESSESKEDATIHVTSESKDGEEGAGDGLEISEEVDIE